MPSHSHDEIEVRFSHNVLPARAVEEDNTAQMGPVTRKIRRAESALQQRVEFEALVSRISGMFVRLRSADLDWGINEALRELGEFIRVDHCHICRVHTDSTLMDHTYKWSANGEHLNWEGSANVRIDDQIPWAATRLRRLDGIAVYSVDTLGPEAKVDQITFRKQGIKSVIFVPMAVSGDLVGFVALDSTRMEMHWTDDAISLLKIVAAIIGDAMERRQAEDALRKENAFTNALFNASGAVIIVLDTEGRIIRFNPAAEEVTGLSSVDTIGHAPWDLFVPRDERAAERRIFRRLTAGAPSSAHEGNIFTKDGERRVISWSNTSISSGDGRVAYVIMSGIDVTETKRLEADVLNVAEEEQSRFGHDLHDGLGQHLTGIEFMSHVLQQKLASRSAPEASEMEEIARLIREAIGHTRDLARGLSPVLLQSKGLAVALQDLADSTTRHMRGVRCSCQTAPDLHPVGNEKAIHLYRIAQEAVANAAKHGRATEILISIRELENHLQLSIEDNGRGFPEGPPGGTGGMGLRVMHYRAGIIGGTLDIAQHPGDGVTVTATLDLSRLSPREISGRVASGAR
jgi:PAS domain S-box-containing protein